MKDEVLVIEDGVLKKCTDDSITSVVIPDSVKKIGVKAFKNCYNLESMEIPPSVKKIGEGAFARCESLSSVVIPSSVTEIVKETFYCCSSLSSVEIPSSVTKIGEGAFACCKSLSSVVIPPSVTKICKEAFNGCKSLSSVEIPSSVTEIGKEAFNGCKSLSSVEIPPSVTKIGKEAFKNCNISELSHPLLTIKNGVAIKDNQVLYCTSQSSSITIPDGVTEIGKDAFFGCESLESVEIPSSVTKICKEAFNGCKSLSSVEIPSSVTEIGNSAFKGCNIDNFSHPLLTIENGCALKENVVLYCTSQSDSIKIPDGVEEICESAFSGCKLLESVEIPSSVTEIGDGAFYGCESLSSVTLGDDFEEVPSEWFDDLNDANANYEIVCTEGSSTYKAIKRSRKLKAHVKTLALHNAKEWTEEEKLSFIETNYRKDGEGCKWVLLYVKNGYEYGMREAMCEMRGDDYGFGKEVVAVFNTKEGALQYYLDNKLYEKAYNDILESNDLENAFEDWVYDDNGEVSLDDIRSYLGDCAGNGDAWKNFYYELVSVEAIEK